MMKMNENKDKENGEKRMMKMIKSGMIKLNERRNDENEGKQENMNDENE